MLHFVTHETAANDSKEEHKEEEEQGGARTIVTQFPPVFSLAFSFFSFSLLFSLVTGYIRCLLVIS